MCRDIQIDGLILPDLPFEEKEEFQPICKKYEIDLISFIAPASENRIAVIAQEASGFLYIVSSLGVTGTRTKITTSSTVFDFKTFNHVQSFLLSSFGGIFGSSKIYISSTSLFITQIY